MNLNLSQHYLLGNSITDYIWFAVLFVTGIFLVKPFSYLLSKLGAQIAKRFSHGKYGKLFRSLISRPLQYFFQSIIFYIALNRLQKPFDWVIVHRNYKNEEVNVRLIDVIDHLFIFFVILFTTLLISRTIDFIHRVQLERARTTGQKERTQILPLLKEVIKLLVWVTSFFTMLGIVFHVNVPALITGLGIGGVAIALAGKETVENLFASFTILLDKPFHTEDVVKLGTLEGTVEKIGFRSTRLRNADGSVYIIPNKKLIDENLENLTERETRRIRVQVLVKYGIAHMALQIMIDELKKSVQTTLHVTEPVEVSIENFGENTFQVVVSYHLPFPLTANLPAIKQQINMDIYRIVSSYAGSSSISLQSENKPDFSEEE